MAPSRGRHPPHRPPSPRPLQRRAPWLTYTIRRTHPGDPDPVRGRHPHLRHRPACAGQPGRPVPDPVMPPEQLEALIRLYGLDQPVLEQYVSWITAFVQIWNEGAWGYSFIDGRPVLQIDHRAAAGDAPPHGHRARRDRHRLDPARHPRRGQAVQLVRQGHHHVRDHRLRDPVLPARDLPPVHRRRRATCGFPGSRCSAARASGRRGTRSTSPGTWSCR